MSVVTHEVGHFFGLAHATNPNATMYASYKPGSILLRTLDDDDMDGICSIYPDSSTRIVSPEVSASETVSAGACDPNPRNGFTAECSSPKKEEKCAATPHPSASWGASASVAVAVAGLFVARRRRSQAR